MNRPARICVEVCVAVLGILLVLGGVAVWRLASGPVPVDFLTPYLEQAFNDREDGKAQLFDASLLLVCRVSVADQQHAGDGS